MKTFPKGIDGKGKKISNSDKTKIADLLTTTLKFFLPEAVLSLRVIQGGIGDDENSYEEITGKN